MCVVLQRRGGPRRLFRPSPSLALIFASDLNTMSSILSSQVPSTQNRCEPPYPTPRDLEDAARSTYRDASLNLGSCLPMQRVFALTGLSDLTDVRLWLGRQSRPQPPRSPSASVASAVLLLPLRGPFFRHDSLRTTWMSSIANQENIGELPSYCRKNW